MIQIEIIENIKEKDFVDDVNYFLEKLNNHQLVDIKFNSFDKDDISIYRALIIYIME